MHNDIEERVVELLLSIFVQTHHWLTIVRVRCDAVHCPLLELLDWVLVWMRQLLDAKFS